jgi:hypothetical protein
LKIGKNHMGLAIELCDCKTPFFQLTKPQMRAANDALHATVYKFFTEDVRKRLVGPDRRPQAIKGEHLAPDKVFHYMQRLVHGLRIHRLRRRAGIRTSRPYDLMAYDHGVGSASWSAASTTAVRVRRCTCTPSR